MSLDKCKTCGDFMFDSHKCLPTWQVVREDEYDDSEGCIELIYSSDASYAAENYVDYNFENWDYPDEIVIWVKKPEDINWNKYTVTVETVSTFSATLIIE